ncbi:MAG: 3D domain-containing protein [Erysipelotrichaceae bacterium]
MKIKRKLFAFFMMMLTLSGCVGADVMTPLAIDNDEITDTASEVVFKTYEEVPEIQDPMSDLEVITEKTKLNNPKTEIRAYDGRAGLSWMASKISNGTPSYLTQDYIVTRNSDGEEISKTPVLGSETVIASEPAVIQYGSQVVVGATFDPRMTTYGVDCVGCYVNDDGVGGTALGVKLSLTQGVMQNNGSFQSGIKYGNYYMVAADPSIPLCSVVEITNHGYSGDGLQAGVPFRAIVVDRGGAIQGAKLDLYVGSEKQNNVSVNYSINNPHVTVLRVGGKISARQCAV